MPIYEFECANVECKHVTDDIYSVVDVPESILCPKCLTLARRIISAGSIHTDEPAWIDQGLRDHIQGDGERPITTRSELDNYCKAKNIEPRC